MGCGVFKNGRYQPITPFVGSWAWEQEQKRAGAQPERKSDGQWPLGLPLLRDPIVGKRVPKPGRDDSLIEQPKGSK